MKYLLLILLLSCTTIDLTKRYETQFSIFEENYLDLPSSRIHVVKYTIYKKLNNECTKTTRFKFNGVTVAARYDEIINCSEFDRDRKRFGKK